MSEHFLWFLDAAAASIPIRSMPPSWCPQCYCRVNHYTATSASCRHCGWKWDQQ